MRHYNDAIGKYHVIRISLSSINDKFAQIDGSQLPAEVIYHRPQSIFIIIILIEALLTSSQP